MADIVKRPWTDQEVQQLKQMYAEGIDTRDIAKALGRTRRSIRGKAHGLRLSHKTRDDYLYRPEEDAFIIENAKKMTRAEIGIAIGRSEGSVSRRGERLEIDFKSSSKNTRYTKNMNFFSSPNIFNSYIAGWIASDGWIRPESVGKPINQVGIAVSEKDRFILEHIKTSTEYTGTIREFEVDIFPQTELRMSGVPQWLKDLKQHWNIVPNKTYILQPPKKTALSHAQLLAYHVGLMEGDGHVGMNNGTLLVSFVSASKPFVNWVGQFWEQLIQNTPSYHVHTSGKAYYVNLHGKNARNLCRNLFKVEVHRMNRKWDIVKTELDRWSEID